MTKPTRSEMEETIAVYEAQQAALEDVVDADDLSPEEKLQAIENVLDEGEAD